MSDVTSLTSFPGHLIRRLQQIAVSVFISRLEAAGHDLTPVQYGALAMIRANPGIAQSTLAGLIAHDPATIGAVVERLVQKGLVERKTSAVDRRARSLYLTEAGLGLLTAATPVVKELQDTILAGLTPSERRTFVQLLRKATDAGNELSRAPLRSPEADSSGQ